jgi:hypothetical protein
MDVEDDALRWIILGVATLLYGLMGFSMEFVLLLVPKFEDPRLGEYTVRREVVMFVSLSLAFLEVLLVFWIPTNLLDNVHIIAGLVGGITLIQIGFISVGWYLLKENRLILGSSSPPLHHFALGVRQ